MDQRFLRTEMLLGAESMHQLREARVAVFGLGGVGGYAAEALARSGVGTLHLIDHDRVSLTNLNRQILAVESTVGRPKTEVMRERLLSINPELRVILSPVFYLPENQDQFDFAQYDYIVDAIDTVTAKISLAVRAFDAGVPIISCMGTGNKLEPTALEVADLYDTSVCPLAKVLRRELKKRGIPGLKVVYSRELPRTPIALPGEELTHSGRSVPASAVFVPGVAGLIAAGEVIKDLTISREELERRMRKQQKLYVKWKQSHGDENEQDPDAAEDAVLQNDRI